MTTEFQASPDDQSARSQRFNRRLECAVALFFVAIGAVILREVWARLPLFDFGQVGPGLLPTIVAVLMIGLGGFLAYSEFRRAGVDERGVVPTKVEALRVLSVIALFIVAMLAIPYVGMVPTLGLFVLVETRLIERRPILPSLLTAIIVPVFIYLTFEALLHVGLPEGLLRFL